MSAHPPGPWSWRAHLPRAEAERPTALIGPKFVIRCADGLFWRPNACGYTANLLEAGVYTEERARQQERVRRDCPEIAVPLTEALAELRINPEVLDALLLEQARGGR